MRLALDQRQLSKIIAIEIEKIEGHQDDLCRLSLQLVLKDEKSVVPSAVGTTISPSMMAEPAAMCQASSATFLNRVVRSLPRRVKTLTASFAK